MKAYPFAGEKIVLPPSTTIESPAFDVQPPPIRNIDLIDAGARSAMDVSWSAGTFRQRSLGIYRIQQAFFTEECLIFDDDLRVIANASDAYTDEEVSRALATTRSLLEASKLPHFKGPAVVSKRRATSNYGHFLLEMLPMAILGRAVVPPRETMFLAHRLPAPMLDVTLRCMRLLDIDLHNVLFCDYGEPIHFEELVVVRGLTTHGTYMSPLCAEAVGKLASHVPPGKHSKIFVTRGAGLKRGRALVNQDELQTRLARRGYVAVDTSRMTVEEQIATFSGAESIIGVAGAAMSNIVFCRPGTRVFSLAGPDFSDTFFWFIATHRKLYYQELRCPKVGGADFNPNADFQLQDVDAEWLESVG